MKMFQVHDDNHTAMLTIAADEGEALRKVWDSCEEMQESFEEYEEYLETFMAEEIKDLSRIDNDGPVSFF